MKDRPLMLVDGSSYLYRAYHAVPPMLTRKGQPTGAIKGVLKMIRKLKREYAGYETVLVFDAKGKTFRHDIYPDYKANRPSMPEDLDAQLEPLFNVITAWGIPLIIEPGVEADDTIGTMTNEASKKGREVVISTGDKDMAQLVASGVTLVNTMTGTTLDKEGVIDKFGVSPEYIIDYLALLGDKSDNIPGVEGVGVKTAAALISRLGHIENIYSNIHEVAGLGFRGAKSVAKKLEASRDLAFLSKILATIKTDVPLNFSVDGLKKEPVNKASLVALFEELEFQEFLDSMVKKSTATNN